MNGKLELAYGASIALASLLSLSVYVPSACSDNQPIKLIFVYHSCGSSWLSDGNGGLGIALRDNSYFVSGTNYSWGLDTIGSNTDIGHWWAWFRGPNSAIYLDASYAENETHTSYSRLASKPGGENEIIMFKPCYPNSALNGNLDDSVPPIDSNRCEPELRIATPHRGKRERHLP